MFRFTKTLASKGSVCLKPRLPAVQPVARPTRNVTTTRIVRVKKETTAKDKAPAEAASSQQQQQQIVSDSVKSTVGSVSSAAGAGGIDGPALNGVDYFPGTEDFDPVINGSESSQNWSTSFHGLSTQPFSREISDILMQPVDMDDIEIKPDGLLYLPEIKYRRILNKAFGPGGWGLAPRGEHSISKKNVSREYALICHGRFVSQARGEQAFFDPEGLATAAEGCKSNALMRCCKDLGIASELWDPVFIRKYKKKYCVEVWAEHVTTKKKKRVWRKKDETLEYPYKEL